MTFDGPAALVRVDLEVDPTPRSAHPPWTHRQQWADACAAAVRRANFGRRDLVHAETDRSRQRVFEHGTLSGA